MSAAALDAARRFALPGEPSTADPLGSGHIHQTYRVAVIGRETRYVLQRINRDVFPDVEGLMRNLERVTAHLRAETRRADLPEPERRCLRWLPDRDGASWAEVDGAAWRCCVLIEGTLSHDVVTRHDQAREAARAFGAFAAALGSLPAPAPVETIPGFHDLDRRIRQLAAADRADRAGRRAGALPESDAAARLGDTLAAASQALAPEPLPRRVVHNDCKVNNLLFDAGSGEGLCVIDLDTVAEETLLCDFGELTRTALCAAAEDEADLARIRFDAERFAALAEGYVLGAGSLVSPAELRALALAGPRMAYENAVRFLADHLDGDVYFHVDAAGHNLRRARAQLRLTECLLDHREDALRVLDTLTRHG